LKQAQEAVTADEELAALNQAAFLPGLATSLITVAGILRELGCPEEALERAQQAVTAYRKLAGLNRAAFLPGLAASLNNLTNMLRDLGRRGEALKSAQEAVTACRKLARLNQATFLPGLAASLNALATVLSTCGRPKEAIERAQEAVKIYGKLPDATRRALAEQRSNVYFNIALLCLKPDKSGARDLTGALDALRQSIRCIEDHRGSFREDAQRRRVLAGGIRSYELLVQTAVDLWDIQRDVEHLRVALHAAEGLRQRQLLERLRAEVLEPDAPQVVRHEWRRRFEELEAAEFALQTFALRSPGTMFADMGTGHASPMVDDPYSALREEPAEVDQERMRMELERRRDEAFRRHERALRAVHDTHTGFDPYQPVPLANHEDAQRLLEAIPGTVLVEYVVSRGGGYALLVCGAQVHAVCLPEASVGGALDLARRWMEGYTDPARSMEEKVAVLTRWGEGMKAKLLEFAPKVLWPVLRALKEFEQRHQFEAERLVLCPHQFLNLLPFHAMPLEGQADGLLVDRYEISYSPSLSVMKRCAGRRPGTGRQILFGNPINDLPFIGVATEAYRRDHPGAEVIHGRSASVEQLIQSGSGMGRGEIWAHMNASNDPMTAGIRLGDGEELQLERIYRELRLRLKPHLTLNGCESGLMNPVRRKKSARDATELAVDDLTDFDGLPMGFLFAGARSVVGTLWKVFDVSAALLMDRYHLELRKDGATPVGALRRASQWLRKEIRNGADLLSAGESLLARVPEQWARAHPRQMEYCRRVLAREAAEHPEDPPFANPIHWASHFVTGWSWDSVE
jgi:CHAT domain-containing protein